MQTTIKVRGYHLDVYQHVNNARYRSFWKRRAGSGWKMPMPFTGCWSSSWRLWW